MTEAKVGYRPGGPEALCAGGILARQLNLKWAWTSVDFVFSVQVCPGRAAKAEVDANQGLLGVSG